MRRAVAVGALDGLDYDRERNGLHPDRPPAECAVMKGWVFVSLVIGGLFLFIYLMSLVGDHIAS